MQKIIHWSFELINLLLKGEITLTFNINNQLFFQSEKKTEQCFVHVPEKQSIDIFGP